MKRTLIAAATLAALATISSVHAQTSALSNMRLATEDACRRTGWTAASFAVGRDRGAPWVVDVVDAGEGAFSLKASAENREMILFVFFGEGRKLTPDDVGATVTQVCLDEIEDVGVRNSLRNLNRPAYLGRSK